MNRRQFLTTTALGAAGLMLGKSSFAAKNNAKAPNILFFFIDDQRDTTLGVAGDPIVKTPTIDKLANQGVYFENSFVTTSICAASRASVLTGLTERTHGYTFGKPPIPRPFVETSYPALLKQAGYHTGFFGKFGVKTEGNPKKIMFDEFSPRDRPYLRKQKDGSIRHIDEMNTEEALGFLDTCTDDQPFCLSLCFSSAHAEDKDLENHYPGIDPVKGMYEDVTFPTPRLGDPEIFDNQPEFLKESLNRERYFWRWDTPEKYQKNMRAYYRLISGIDHMMNQVMTKLEAQGLAENTIIIYAADNGYYMGDRGFAGKWSHYEESLRVPLIIFDPRQPEKNRGRKLEAMALNIDIPATILDLTGVKPPKHYQGESLVPWLNGKTPREWRTDFFAEHRMDYEKIPMWEGIREERYVYARYDTQNPPYEFLHDLKTDPDQLKNFADDPACQDILNKLRKRCDKKRDSYIKTRKAAL